MRARRKTSFGPRRLFFELKWETFKALLVNELLNATLVFFIVNFILAFFGISSLWAVIPAVLGIVMRIRKGFKKSTVLAIEKGNPEVNELLRTAYEYRKENSLMAQGLVYDLQKKLNTVSTGVLISPASILFKFFIILLLALTPMIMIGLFPTLLQENPLEGIDIPRIGTDYLGAKNTKDFDAKTTKLSTDGLIYGDNQLIELGDEEYTILAKNGLGANDLSSDGDVEDKSFSSSSRTPDVYVPQDTKAASGVGVFAQEDKELVSEYSCIVKGTC